VPLPASKQLWAAASDGERRALVEEMVEGIEVSPDDLEVAVFGAPRLNATLAEVGLGGDSRRMRVSEGRHTTQLRGP